MHYYDLYVPLVKNIDKKFTYDQARDLVLECVQPLGDEYVQNLKKGLTVDRWVDKYENQNKRSGAFSWNSYDSKPYILMNFKGTLRDVFTLAHESGHSMHALFSKSQPYQYSGTPIFIAEVASIFNEELLRHMLLQRVKSPDERAYLINQALEDIRTAIIRQVIFAEFELFAHSACESGIPLTPKLLKDKYLELVSFYYGPDLTLDPEVGIEWAKVPHFFANFYVYQYATGKACAISLADAALQGEKDRYLNFLRAGSSDYPIELLAKAGCDMRTSMPVHKALDRFDAYLAELEQLTKGTASQ
jgi:oligoendopeptidase F